MLGHILNRLSKLCNWAIFSAYYSFLNLSLKARLSDFTHFCLQHPATFFWSPSVCWCLGNHIKEQLIYEKGQGILVSNKWAFVDRFWAIKVSYTQSPSLILSILLFILSYCKHGYSNYSCLFCFVFSLMSTYDVQKIICLDLWLSSLSWLSPMFVLRSYKHVFKLIVAVV
jgi:hypothetical protein